MGKPRKRRMKPDAELGSTSAALKNVSSWIDLREVDRHMTRTELARRLRAFEWSSAFRRLALYASFLANNPDSLTKLRAFLQVALERSSVPEHRRVGLALSTQHPSRPLAHGAVINLLQANVILQSSESGHEATDADLAYLLLGANAFAGDWNEPAERNIFTNKERNLANSARGMLYARGADTVHTLLRVEEIFGTVPERTSDWDNTAAWSQVQQRVLGSSISDYVELLAGPLVIQTATWAREGLAEGESRPPELRPEAWLRETKIPAEVGRDFLSSLAVTREEAREELERQRGAHEIVLAPTVFVRRPLVWISETHVAAAAPWFLEDQIRMGVWARFLQYAKSEYGAFEKWTSAFGDMFELRCVSFVDRALKTRGRGDIRRAHSATWGKEEDIVLIEGNAIIVISVKASTMPEDRLKGARSIQSVVEWYERFYFGKRAGRRRAGAVHLLQKKVDAIRAGTERIPPRPKVFPVVLTYDRLSADNPGAYRWVTTRCNTERLLSKCEPLTLLDIDDFELLMAVIANGRSLRSILEHKTSGDWRYGRLSLLIHEQFTAKDKRLPWAEAAFDDLSARIKRRLFGVQPDPP